MIKKYLSNKNIYILIASLLIIIYFITILCTSPTLEIGTQEFLNYIFYALPHLTFLMIGLTFGLIGFCTNKKSMMLTSAIFYCLGGILYIITMFAIAPSIVLSFVGYYFQKKAIK